MKRPLHLLCFLMLLLLPACSYAAMLAHDLGSTEENLYKTPAPISELKEKLDQARIKEKTPNTVSTQNITWDKDLLKSNQWKVHSADIIDVSSSALDNNEKSCNGQFSSQMGVPENSGPSQIIQMESKCVSNTSVIVSVWLIETKNNITTLWQMSAPRDQRGLVFNARDKMVAALKSK